MTNGGSQFVSRAPTTTKRRLSSAVSDKLELEKVAKPVFDGVVTTLWAGIAGTHDANGKYDIVISINDSVYAIDFAWTSVPYQKDGAEANAKAIEQHILQTLRNFSKEHMCKFLGAGVSLSLLGDSPNLCTRLWLDLDIVPVVFDIKPYHFESHTRTMAKNRLGSMNPSGAQTPLAFADAAQVAASTAHQSLFANNNHLQVTGANINARLPIPKTLDEMADSAARKVVMYYGPNNNPRLSIGGRNQVLVDADGKIHLIDDVKEYERTVGKRTWNAVQKLASELREKKIKIGFFSSTPQGGGVALMRHALVRFLVALDIDVAWYVPNPSPQVFRITKNNHNILQGVADPSIKLTDANKATFDAWIQKNGLRWTAEGGPLAPGGVDVAFIDDPQMPGLIPLIKKVRPDLPIVYRSHIEIRSDLVHREGSEQENVWKYLWNNIQHADLFISHPVNKFVPDDVPIEKVALQGAATDWLDGLNKPMDPHDSAYYMGEFRQLCHKERMYELAWPEREYFVQIARFDPSKGIPDVIDSYAKFRQILKEEAPGLKGTDIPQLLICGHGAVDDPDASIIYDSTIQLIAEKYVEFSQDIVLMRLPASDQLLNALLANAKVALQLSTREGFEVKVSEAVHAGIPVVAAHTGGIPLQLEHGKSGYLTVPGDTVTVARYLYDLYTDAALHKRMSQYAKTHVSDEVGTVGNAAAWMYLAVMYASRKVKLQPKGAWLNDMLREETGELYEEGEARLPREELQLQ